MPLAEPQTSVIIAYYRNAATLGEQLTALTQQQDPPPFELVIADNEGSAELAGIVADFQDRLAIRIVAANQQRGQCYARNAAAEAATTELLLFCDADDVVGPDWVRSLYRTILEADVLATGPLRVDRLNAELVWQTYLSAGTAQGNIEASLVRPFVVLEYLPLVIGCSMAIRRDTFNRLGRLDPTMLGGSEDADLAWRAQEAGIEIKCVDEALVDYRLRSGVKEIFQQRRHYEHSKLRLWARSRRMGRGVRGMSFRWVVIESLKLLPRWWRLRKASYAERYVAAFQAGSIVGNLEGQLRFRFLKLDR